MTNTQDQKIRVLFIYGLEGHPNGSKIRMLREQGVEVFAPDMGMSLWGLRQPNGMLRQALRDPEFLTFALGVGVGVVAARRSLAWGLASAAGLALWGATRQARLWERSLARSLARCVEIQQDAIQKVRPDVVIGSSWGGAVAAELLVRGIWSGPLLLLAPAIERVADLTKRPNFSEYSEKLRHVAQQHPLVIFHDPDDETIPFAHSVKLAQGSAIVLHGTRAGGHRLMDLVAKGTLAEAIQAYGALMTASRGYPSGSITNAA